MEKPTLKQRVSNALTFLWDSENGKVLGRGGRSWAEIGLFYLIYYACLASFFAATIAVFYQTIDTDEPRLTSDSSLLNGNPGMGYRPIPDIDEAVIKAKKVAGKNTDYVENMKEFLEKYSKIGLETADCSNVDVTRPKEKTACRVDYPITNECVEANEYGMVSGKPCVVLKLNKVFGWEPKLWDSANDSSLPEDLKAVYSKSIIPVKCYAKEKSDRDDLGMIDYFPQQGYPVAFFPYMKQKDYLAPLVFAQFKNITVGKTIAVECRTYAKNIDYDRADMQGSVKFEIKVSD